MHDGAIFDLNSKDPQVRFKALMDLRSIYEPEVGTAMIQSLIKEEAHSVWWLSAMCVLPIWLPEFDRTVGELEGWPFSGARTLHILERTKAHELHCAEKHVESWLSKDDWEFKFAAFRWQVQSGTMQGAYDAAISLSETIAENFHIPEESLKTCFWMDDFNNKHEREQELLRFIAECNGEDY